MRPRSETTPRFLVCSKAVDLSSQDYLLKVFCRSPLCLESQSPLRLCAWDRIAPEHGEQAGSAVQVHLQHHTTPSAVFSPFIQIISLIYFYVVRY